MLENNKRVILTTLFVALFLVISLFKVSFLWGSQSCFFSGISFVLPLIGAFFSLPVSVFLISLFFIFKIFTFKALLIIGLPTLIAAICFNVSLKREKSKLIKFGEFSLKVLLPLLCVFLFVTNPVGKGAFIYSFY